MEVIDSATVFPMMYDQKAPVAASGLGLCYLTLSRPAHVDYM